MNFIEKQLHVQRNLFIFSTVILLGFALLNPLIWYKDEVRWQNVQTWQKIPATVVSHQKTEIGSGRNRRTYSNITYRFVINKKVHFGYDSGLGGRNLLPSRFHTPGSHIHCFFNPATGETMLDYRPDNQWIYLFGMVFFGGFAIVSIANMMKVKKFDSRTLPREFAERLQPVPELPNRLHVRWRFFYKNMLDDPAIPGKIFQLPNKGFLKILHISFFAVLFVALATAAYLAASWWIGILAVLQLIPLSFGVRSPRVLVINTESQSIYFTSKADRMIPAKQSIHFSEIQSCYLVWMTKADCMGFLLQTARGGIVIGCKDGQQLMHDTVKTLDILNPELPIYDLIHRDFDHKKRQGYILM